MRINIILSLIVFLTPWVSVEAAITCLNSTEECVEPEETRLVGPNNDTPLHLPCWRYKTTYECKTDALNDCKPLVSAGCSPIAADCKEHWAGICAVRRVTYDCPEQLCKPKVECKKGQGFCLTGECLQQERSKDSDMHQALSALSAAAEASKSYGQDLTIFKGQAAECSINIVDSLTKDCCGSSPSGFLEGILLSCDDEEKVLAAKKAAGAALEIGEYCHRKVAKRCTSTHKVYCTFGSKLGRIIQVAAAQQLGVSFGDPKGPICNGITPEQFQTLDFSKIDFSEFYREIESKQRENAYKYTQGNVQNAMKDKLESLKTKLKVNADRNVIRADELRAK